MTIVPYNLSQLTPQQTVADSISKTNFVESEAGGYARYTALYPSQDVNDRYEVEGFCRLSAISGTLGYWECTVSFITATGAQHSIAVFTSASPAAGQEVTFPKLTGRNFHIAIQCENLTQFKALDSIQFDAWAKFRKIHTTNILSEGPVSMRHKALGDLERAAQPLV